MGCLEKARDKRIATTEELIAKLTPFLTMAFDDASAARAKKPGKSLVLDTQETWTARPADPTYGGAMPPSEDAFDSARTQVDADAAETLVRLDDDDAPLSRRDRPSIDQMGIATMVKAPRPELKPAAGYTPRAGEATVRSPYPESATMRAARKQYFDANGFGDDGGYDDAWVAFKLGPIPFPFPNTSSRKRAVRVHDLHHIVTGYATSLVGEFEISAWELGAGCADFFAAWQLNLAGMFGGLLIAPRRTFRAFVRGRRSQSLYGREDLELLLEKSVGETRAIMHVPSVNPPARAADVAWFLVFEFVGALAATLQLALGLTLLPLGLLFAALGKGRRRATPSGPAAG